MRLSLKNQHDSDKEEVSASIVREAMNNQTSSTQTHGYSRNVDGSYSPRVTRFSRPKKGSKKRSGGVFGELEKGVAGQNIHAKYKSTDYNKEDLIKSYISANLGSNSRNSTGRSSNPISGFFARTKDFFAGLFRGSKKQPVSQYKKIQGQMVDDFVRQSINRSRQNHSSPFLSHRRAKYNVTVTDIDASDVDVSQQRKNEVNARIEALKKKNLSKSSSKKRNYVSGDSNIIIDGSVDLNLGYEDIDAMNQKMEIKKPSKSKNNKSKLKSEKEADSDGKFNTPKDISQRLKILKQETSKYKTIDKKSINKEPIDYKDGDKTIVIDGSLDLSQNYDELNSDNKDKD